MVHKVPAIGLSARPYFKRSSFSHGAKGTLHKLCRVMGLPGKPDGINGAEVAQYYRDGRIREIADYCESDVVNTYRVWLRHELFQGRISEAGFEASESNLDELLKARRNVKLI
jgi:predicted PolB exonuclease-like 3'-5' exonuclease